MNVRKRKAISPLIATLLLIAIAVAASVLTYSWVMSMVGSQSAQAQTQLRIDSVTWHGVTAGPPNTATGFSLVIRNTGSVSATVESISIRPNTAGSTIQTFKPTSAASVDVGLTLSTTAITTWDVIPKTGMSPVWTVSNSYVIRVTATTGFYYELVGTTPSTVPAS